MALHHNLRALRRRAKIGQAEVAAALEVAIPTVSEWETGKKSPGRENLIALANFYSTSVEELLKDDAKNYEYKNVKFKAAPHEKPELAIAQLRRADHLHTLNRLFPEETRNLIANLEVIQGLHETAYLLKLYKLASELLAALSNLRLIEARGGAEDLELRAKQAKTTEGLVELAEVINSPAAKDKLERIQKRVERILGPIDELDDTPFPVDFITQLEPAQEAARKNLESIIKKAKEDEGGE